MTAITIRKLPDGVKQRLRMRAASHGTSMEAEARKILLDALDDGDSSEPNWVQRLMARADELGGVEIPIPEDQPATFPDFSWVEEPTEGSSES